MSKVFGIGLHKTGTTTLAECLRTLGYSVCPEEFAYFTRQETASGKYAASLVLARSYDAFEDSPWNYKGFYQVLNAVFPTARFILTTRDKRNWFKSLLRWTSLYNSGDSLNLIATLGIPVTREDRERLVAAYHAHNDGIVEYFAGQPGKLLVVDWEAGDGWEKLCGFLGVPVPQLTFPHALRYDSELLEFVTSDVLPLKEVATPALPPLELEEVVAPAVAPSPKESD